MPERGVPLVAQCLVWSTVSHDHVSRMTMWRYGGFMSRALQRVALMAALFALVFAPGGAARTGGDDGDAGTRGGLAGAVLAPTFDQEELSGRRATELDAPGWLVLLAVVVGLVVAFRHRWPQRRLVLAFAAAPHTPPLTVGPPLRGPPPSIRS